LKKSDLSIQKIRSMPFSPILKNSKMEQAYNLTGLKTDRDIIIKHFLDSLLFAKELPHGALSLADIGSGAGFPGIPIKIMFPDLSLFL